ncbi:MAG TPA: hypothetical protein VHM19_04335, partial [Polyangiales bacterium]|nr:hypothetical protein [Polyangiales bacterium]
MFFALYAVLLGVALAALIMLARRARELFWRAPVLPAALQSALRELGTGDRALTTLAEELE